MKSVVVPLLKLCQSALKGRLGGKANPISGQLSLLFPPTLSALAKIARFYSGGGPVIGIDLGTTNSCVSVMKEDKKPHIIENQEGRRTTPSIVAFTKAGVLVGDAAKRQFLLNSENTISSSKRLIGRKASDKEVLEAKESASYKIVPHENGDAWVEAAGKKYSPAQIGAFILQKLKDSAEKYLGTKVRRAVITVPAYFTDTQRKATKNAGTIAGLEVLRVINEPTAAALSYGVDTSQDGVIAVYDLGGGTFDVSVLEIKDGVFEVLATGGDSHLGGEDFDSLLTRHLLAEIQEKTGADVATDLVALQRVRAAAEKAKCELSTLERAEVSIPYLTHKAGMPLHFETTIDRGLLESVVSSLVERTIGPCRAAMREAGIEKGQVRHVLMVGGMSRMPKIRETVREVFGVYPTLGINPDEAVATGAALQGSIIAGTLKDVLLIDVAPLSLGIETLGGVFSKIIDKNTSIPVKKSQTFTTAEDGQTSVNIKIYEGERPLIRHNKFLGEIVLSGIPVLPKGVPQIEVTFEADADGIYTVTALDKKTEAEQEIKIQPSGGLSEEEVQRMVAEAEANREADEKIRAFIEEKQRTKAYLEDNKKARDRLRKTASKKEMAAVDEAAKEAEQLMEVEAGDAESLAAAVTGLKKKMGRLLTHV